MELEKWNFSEEDEYRKVINVYANKKEHKKILNDIYLIKKPLKIKDDIFIEIVEKIPEDYKQAAKNSVMDKKQRSIRNRYMKEIIDESY